MGAEGNEEGRRGNGRQVASRKLQAGGGYGTIGQQTERLQPGSNGAATIKHTQAGGDLKTT